MLTGINFSPPLYFLFNFSLQLIFQTSIEQLRIQSLAFIIIGIILTFLLTRKIFGTTIAFFSTILVASQSNLLLSQAQEARHYAMFFAFGAWVLYMQYLSDGAVKKYKWLNFFSHICLCQVHYLGIIFSGLVGISYLISNKEKSIFKNIPFTVITSWIISIPAYLFFHSIQSSHLGNWPKPNELSDLLAGYNKSLLILTVLIPISGLLLTNNPNKNNKKGSIKRNSCSRTILVTSILWLFVPCIFWTISRISSLNLFVDRYFIPKEAALILLVTFAINLIFQNFPKQKSRSTLMLGTLALAIVLLLMSTKRVAFGLNKDTNYHHSLIIEESFPESKQPIILQGDPDYFPNAYLGKNECLFALNNESLIELYKRFSSKIKFLD